MVGAKGRHPVRRAVVDCDPDGDTPLERYRDADPDSDANPYPRRQPDSDADPYRDASLDRYGDANYDGIYADNCDTDIDTGRNR